jgi:peptidylprolyl isomerase
MSFHGNLCALALIAWFSGNSFAATANAARPTMAGVLAASVASDWRPVDADNTLYVQLPQGRVVIELAPLFAPLHAANIKTLVREHYFDGLTIVRVQDNYVVQWGDPENRHPTPASIQKVATEFDRPIDAEVPFTRLAERDTYAAEVGFSQGLPVARDPRQKLMWLAHCYGMVGVGRDDDPQSGSGAELYVVIGHSPRHLDRNVAVVGRVIQGIELLASLPRGTGAMGFYVKPEQRTTIQSIRVAADVPADSRANLEVMRTDSPRFAALIQARRNRSEDWFKTPAGHIDLCNVPIPVREAGAPH